LSGRLLKNSKHWHKPLIELKQATIKITKQATQVLIIGAGPVWV
jgi:hypothetical protein